MFCIKGEYEGAGKNNQESSSKLSLYGDDIIYEIRDALQENDPIMYGKWKENEFGLDYIFYGEYALLHLAAENYNIEMAKALVEDGANVDVANDYGKTPLYSAVRRGGVKMVKFLIENGASVSAVDEFKNTPLHVAVGQAPWSVKIVIIKILIENGASVSAVDQLEKTPLHSASGLGDIDVVKVMIKNGADVNEVSLLKDTPLHEAVERGTAHVVRILIDSGADINTVGYRRNTPLHEAAQCGAADVVRILIESGANVNVVSRYYKCTPLHLAAEHNHLEVVKCLVDSGADLNTSPKGKVPLDYAKEGGYKEIIEYLEGKMAEVSRSQHDSSQTSKKVCGESLDPKILFGIDNMAIGGKSSVKKEGSKKKRKVNV